MRQRTSDGAAASNRAPGTKSVTVEWRPDPSLASNDRYTKWQDLVKGKDESQDILTMVGVARAELKAFAMAEQPPTCCGVREYLRNLGYLVVYVLRPFLKYVCLPDFLHQSTQLGGPSRIHVLLTVANFDTNSDGAISTEERAAFHRLAEKIVNDFVSAQSSLSIVSTLLLSATLNLTIGPWQAVTREPGQSFKAYQGDVDAYQPLMWVAFSLNIILLMLAALVMILSIWFRMIAAQWIPSPAGRVCFLLESNAMGVLGTLVAMMFCVLTPLVACGGLLAQNGFGWLAVVCCAATYHFTVVILMPHVVSCHRHMHTEARRLLSVKKPDV